MGTDEKLHPGHHSIRLKRRDYSQPDNYFVTICAHERKCILGKIADGRVELSSLGQIVRGSWIAIPSHFVHVNLHDFVIMPNHLHGLIEISRQAGAQRAAPLQIASFGEKPRPAVRAGSLGAIVQSFKAAVTLRARKELGWTGEIWQRNYFERVVRDGREFSDACGYISQNPVRWGVDQENPDRKQTVLALANGAQRAAALQRESRD